MRSSGRDWSHGLVRDVSKILCRSNGQPECCLGDLIESDPTDRAVTMMAVRTKTKLRNYLAV